MKYKFHTTPWKHQLEGLEYFMNNSHGALYTDMGSGKSKIIIDTIINRGFKTVLIVCPVSIGKTWVEQFNTHAPHKNVIIRNLIPIDGTAKKLSEAKFWHDNKTKSDKVNILIVNYESVWREPLKGFLIKAKIDAVICDESHKIKSPSSKCSGMLTMLGRRTKHKYLITGTPLSQSPLDIYAQYRFLDNSIFGTNYELFKQQYANWYTPSGGYPMLDKKVPYKNLDELKEKMMSIAFNIPVVQNLPETQDITVEFELSSKAQKAYKTILEKGGLEMKSGEIVTSANILAETMKLQQLTSGYLPLENIEEGTKRLVQGDKSRLETLRELLEDIDPKEPVVVFCRFTQDIKNVKEVCDDINIKFSVLSGKEDTMSDWDAGKTTIMIIQIQSGAEGLNNLVKSRYCIYYSIHPSLSMWKQSRKRQHRPGQTRNVVYYKLIPTIKGLKTIDQKIYEAIEKNEKVVDYIMKNGIS